MRRHAFTLVEVVTVVLILGILATVAAGRFIGLTDDARTAMIMRQVDTLQTRVELYAAAHGGELPTTIPARWFHGGKLPHHPDNTYKITEVEVDDNSGALVEHPTARVLTSKSAGAFWYNTSNGVIRARVPWQGNSAATAAYYNRVNRSAVDSTGFTARL